MCKISVSEDFQVPETDVVLEKGDQISVRPKMRPPNIYFQSTSNSVKFSEDEYAALMTRSFNGPMLDTNKAMQKDLPTAWDVVFNIEGDDLVIEGSAGAGGYGSITITVPKRGNGYQFVLDPKDAQAADFLKELLEAHRFAYTERR